MHNSKNNKVAQKYTHNYSTRAKKHIKLNENFRDTAIQANAKFKGRKSLPKDEEQLVWGVARILVPQPCCLSWRQEDAPLLCLTTTSPLHDVPFASCISWLTAVLPPACVAVRCCQADLGLHGELHLDAAVAAFPVWCRTVVGLMELLASDTRKICLFQLSCASFSSFYPFSGMKPSPTMLSLPPVLTIYVSLKTMRTGELIQWSRAQEWGCSCRASRFNSQHLRGNSQPPASSVQCPLLPPSAPGTCAVHIYTCWQNIHIHQNKQILKLWVWELGHPVKSLHTCVKMSVPSPETT